MKNFLRKLFGRERDAHPFCSAVVAAAGGSSRMGGVNKLLLPLEGIPVLARTLRALDEARLVDEIVVAAREEDLLTIGDLCRTYGVTKPVKIVRGGETRAASVLAAARSGIFFIPAILILPQFLGLLGVQMSQAVADVCSLILTIPLTFSVLAEMKRQEKVENPLFGDH